LRHVGQLGRKVGINATLGTLTLFRSEVPILNLSFVESRLTREFVNPVSENLHQHTMGLLGQVFFFSLTQKHQVVPLPLKLCAMGLPKHNPPSIFAASLDDTFVDGRIQFFKFLPRCGDVELFANSRLLNNTHSDVGTAVDVFNQLGAFVRCHAEYLNVEHAHDIQTLFLR